MRLRVSLAAFSSAALVSAQPAASAGTLLTCDFNAGAVWPVSSDSPAKPGVTYGKFGTPDTSGSTDLNGKPRPLNTSPSVGAVQ